MGFIGLDVGTTGCRAVAFARDGRAVAHASREYSVDQPRPGWAEQDAELVWSCVESVLASVAADYARSDAAPADPIRALGLSVQGEAVVPLDERGRPLRPVILGMDTRTASECEELRRDWGAAALFSTTGMPVHTVCTLPKLMWLRRNEPGTYAAAARFALYEDFMALRLTGRSVISRCLASRTQLYALAGRDWWQGILDYAGVEPDRLPTLVDSGTVIGPLLPPVARRLGLEPEVVVAAGGHDQACAALGAGVVRQGTAMVSTGTAEVMEFAVDRPILDHRLGDGGISCYEHVVAGKYLLMTLNHAGGLVLRWCRDLVWPEVAAEARRAGRDPYDVLLSGVSDPSGPSAAPRVVFLPYLVGKGTPEPDPSASGAWLGLTLPVGRTEMVRAVLEGLCYELRRNAEFLRDLDVRIDRLAAIGGGARSDVWLQLKADILGLPVTRPAVTEAACLGAGLLAAVAAGELSDLARAVDIAVRVEREYEPDPGAERRYDDGYALYRRCACALGGVWAEGAGLRPRPDHARREGYGEGLGFI